MGSLGIVLVHGYTGGPEDVRALTQRLGRQFGDDAVTAVRLPGHGSGAVPAFYSELFEACIAEEINHHLRMDRRPVLLGHSTGGCLATGYLLNHNIHPAMLILAGTPSRVQGDDLMNWEQHRRHQPRVALGDVARMVAYINRVGRAAPEHEFPVLVLSGSEDVLVPPAQADRWKSGCFKGAVRKITVPGAGHDLFIGPGGPVAADCIARALSDLAAPSPSEITAAQDMGIIEPGVPNYIAAGVSRTRHLANSPAALRVSGKPLEYAPAVGTDPIQLNIEITSRCNLSCGHCARSHLIRPGKDMEMAAFEYLLDLMPNTYKIVLVGLGEPTLHPRVTEFVAMAADRGHRVAMVTNAMTLEKDLSRHLIDAGLHAITFSLDCVDNELASRVRSGTNVERIQGHIADFLDMAEGRVPAAVFSAVSAKTVEHLPELAEVVSQLGMTAWMLSDLNFHANLENGLWKTWRTAYGNWVGRALKTAFANGLPVLSVRGLEELGLGVRYHDYLVTSPAELGGRSATHKWCLSPWQTLPIDVEGYASVCDCRPQAIVGNLLEDPFDDIWNGLEMRAYRRQMKSEAPPEDCRICPRF